MSRRNTRRSSSNAGKPAWVWFVLGNFVGGFVVFMIFLTGLKPESAHTAGSQRAKPSSAREEQRDDDSRPRFDFYTLLQENEVAVPAPPAPKPSLRDASPTRGDTPRENDSGKPPAKDGEQLVYILQAASFKDAAEADRLRAQLTLANLEVQVETASDSRGTWHRVLVGPYRNSSQVAKARQTLAEHQLMPLVLKRPAR